MKDSYRIVKQWADEVLCHYGGNKYGLLLFNGESIGKIHASNDTEAIKKCASISRQHHTRKRENNDILEQLESSNKADMFDSLNDEELHRLKNMLFVWHDLSSREIDRRRVERSRK